MRVHYIALSYSNFFFRVFSPTLLTASLTLPINATTIYHTISQIPPLQLQFDPIADLLPVFGLHCHKQRNVYHVVLAIFSTL